MKSIIKKILNPINLYKAYCLSKSKKYTKANNDLELLLYSKIISTDMLHYGYFEDVNIDVESISIKDIELAQMKYIDLIINQIKNFEKPVLDVGAGMGGLSNALFKKKFNVHALTPDINQKKYIEFKYPHIKLYNMKFEDFSTKNKYGTVINSESLQYIKLDTAFKNINQILHDKGIWIITDYFRINSDGQNKSGHMYNDFINEVKNHDWKIIFEKDITLNSLPTIKYGKFFIDRFVRPSLEFGEEKLKLKSPEVNFFLKDLIKKIKIKFEKEITALDSNKFVKEKKYMLFVISKK
tara:strand:- start:1634 stop:2521 length:888 start_codon:yes stop_codon:yes gene_type:complete